MVSPTSSPKMADSCISLRWQSHETKMSEPYKAEGSKRVWGSSQTRLARAVKKESEKIVKGG